MAFRQRVNHAILATMSAFRTFAGHTLTHMAGAFVVMGGWGLFANRAHPLPDALLAGCVQGLLSALITLVLKTGLLLLARRIGWQRPVLSLLGPPSVMMALGFALLSSTHLLSGTPELWATIVVPFALASGYAWVTHVLNWRAARGEDKP